MADKKHPTKPVRLSESARFSIGGKSFSSQDIVHAQTTDTTPRRVGKELENQSGVIHTSSDTFIPSQSGVHSQTESYKPSVNTQATVQTSIPSEKTSVSVPVSASYVEHEGRSSSVQTGSTIASTAQAQVQSQIEYYKSTSAVSAEQTKINSGVTSTPRTVEAVKTASTTEPPKADTYKPSVNTQTTVPMGRTSEVKPVNPVSVERTNIQTGSTIASTAQAQVQSQTDYFKSTSAVSAEQTKINSGVTSIPRTVEAVKTASASVTSSQPISSFTAVPSYIPKVGNGGAAIGMSAERISEIKQNYSRMGVTQNLTTSSVMDENNAARVFTMTSGAAQLSAARRVIGSSPAMSMNFKTQSVGEFARGLGAVASYTISTEAADALQRWKENKGGNSFLSGGKLMLGKAEGSLLSNDDLGTQSSGGVIAAGMMGYSGFRMSQQATEVGVQGVKSVGNGVYQVSTTVGAASITVGRTAKTLIERQVVPISKEAIGILKSQAVASGLNDTKIAKGIINKVDAVKSAYGNAITNVRHVQTAVGSGIKTIHHTVDRSINIVHGVATGRLTVNAALGSLNSFKGRAFKGLQTGVKNGVRTALGYTVRGAAKGVGVAAFRGVPASAKFLKGGVLTGAGAMMASDDYAVRGVGNAVTAADIGIKTGITGVKATGYSVKTAVKGGKQIYSGAKFIQNNGLRSAWQRARTKAAQKVVQAGKSAVSAVINFVRAAGMKVVLPLLLVVVVAVSAFGAISAPIAATATIFGGVFDTESGEKDIREYITTNIPTLSQAYRQDLANRMAGSWNTHHIVRFYSSKNEGEVVDPTLEGVTTVFPSDEELANMLHPIFNAIILMEYDLEPTDAEAAAVLEELFNGLFRITTAESVEQCGQDLKTGKGEVVTHSCGSVHALADCPNPITGTHSGFTCADCCYYYCNGHPKRNQDGTWTTTYCDGCTFACSGYKNCNSHNVISYTLTLDGAYALEAKYFTDPIDELSNITNRTEEQEIQLQKLKDYYEIYLEIMLQVGAEYGGGLTMSDLSGVQFVNGTRTPNQAVIDLALTQVGQQGGQPYWSYYGFSSRVEWCACFVHWCMNKTPSAVGKYPTTANNAYCPTLTSWFREAGRWGDRTYTNLVAGDTIFFDWEGDGGADHIGLVIGRDNEYVYTVEGNSGDAVKVKQYRIGSSVILGYGLMNY